MNVNRVFGSAVLSLIAVFGTTSAQAETYNWTGASGTDFNWTTEGNWSPTGVPGSADTVAFPNENNAVRLNADKTVAQLSTNQKKIYNDDPTVTNKLTVTGTTYIINNEASGFVEVTTTGGAGYVKGTNKASDGAKLTLHVADFDDNGEQKFVATGEGSKLTVSAAKFYASAGKNTGVSFEAYDGGEVSFKPAKVSNKYRNPQDPITLIARNANLYANDGNATFTKAVYITCDNSYMDLCAVQPAQKGSSIVISNGGMLRLRGTTKYPNGNYASTLTLSDGCLLQQNDGSLSLNQGLTIKLAPTLVSSETSGLIATREDKTGHAITLGTGVKFEIDCSAFANHYGTKTMMVIDQKQPKSTFTCNLPTAASVKLTGDGAANCTAVFAKDSTGKKLMLTITSANLPEGTVAVIEGKAAFTSIQDAIDAAGDDDVVKPVADVVLTETVVAQKSVTLNLNGKTLTMNGTDAAISVGEGAKLTVKDGTVSAPNGVAIAQTAGELDISNTTIQSAGDCVAVSGAGTASLTLGAGNRFTSEGGAAIRETSEEGAAHAILIDDDCRLATEEGVSVYAGQPSFVVSEAFAGKPVVAGTFSSEIAAKYIPDSSKQKQTDDGKWRVSLALDPVLTVGKVTIDANACATFAYELKELGFEQTGATIKADYQVVGATGWTTVEIAKVTEEPFAGTGVIEGLGDGTKYAFRIYAVAGDRMSDVTEESGVAVPFSTTTWTGAADDNLWSTVANWADGHVAFAAQGVTISADYNEKNDIVLDKNATLSGLVFGARAQARISGGHTLTVNEAADKCMDGAQRLFVGANELTISGADTVVDVKPVARLGQSSGVKLVVEDGARFTNNKWVLGDNDNYTFIATNTGSTIAMTIVGNSWAEAGKKDYLFAAYDGATLTVDGTSSGSIIYQGYLDQTSNEPVFLADNATVSVKKIRANGGKPTAISDHGGSLWVGSFTPTVDGARVTCQNGGTFGVYGNLQLSESGKTSTLEILGAGSKISTTSGISANGQVLLGNGTAGKLTVRLAPAADWVTGGARVSSANLVNLKANVKFVIDLANVTADMMKKPMTILSGNGSSSYAIPGKKNVELVNNDNYVVSFAKVGNTLTMTVDNGPGLMLLIK